jgi:polyphenol oxidase
MKNASYPSRRYFLKLMGVGTATLWVPGSLYADDEPTNCAGPTPPAKAIDFTPDTQRSIVQRPSAFSLTAQQKSSLVKAYSALRDLTTKTPDDPRGWMQQGHKHCWQCGGGLDGQAGEEIHGSWLFFPWHRGFLYFHERILGNLANDDSLRLPYWDWDNGSHRSVPPPYLDSKSPLYDAIRSAKAGDLLPITRVPGKSADIVGPDVIKKCMTSPDFATFGGDANNGGNVEMGPHGGVHLWTGETKYPYGSVPPKYGVSDMGLLDTAAQDPVFFSHHCNIDRLWAVWNHSDPKNHTNPPDADWKNHAFNFWDENKKWIAITPAQMIDYQQNLRYSYPFLKLLALPPLQRATVLEVSPENTFKIPGNVVERAPATKREVLLRVDGMSLPPDGGPGFYEIIDSQTGTELGYIAIVPRNSKDAEVHHKANLTFELTEKISALSKSTKGVKLAIRRLSAGPAANQQPAELNFGKVSILER